MLDYRLIAIDIDGTLLDGTSHLRPRVRQALRRAMEAGVRILLCTGRRYRTALPIAQDAGLALPLVCHSGALVKDTGTHRTLQATPLAHHELHGLLDALEAAGLTPMVYTDTFERGRDFVVQAGAPLTAYHEDYFAKNAGHFAEVASLREALGAAVVQVCTFAELDDLRGFKEALDERLDHEVTCHLLSSPHYIGRFLEFQSARASKWAAVRALAASFGVPTEAILALGDDENDISMLRGAGLGVAMGNAAYPVKSAADVVTATNDEDGVARVVEKLLAKA
ncbi:MAG: Cof-type HAD-IIB family hydrolase [Planctomycetota bacterium]